MRLRESLAWTSLWLPGVTVGFALFVNSRNPAVNATPSSIGSAAMQAFIFVLSGIGGSACWDATRYRVIRSSGLVSGTRSRLVAWLLIPLLFWALGGFAILALQTGFNAGHIAFPHPLTVVLAAVTGMAWSCFGITLGWSLPRPLALVLAILTPFVASSYAWTIPNPVWRHMFGVPVGCCKLGGEISQSMVIASVLMMCGIILIGVSLLSSVERRWICSAVRTGAALACVLASFNVANTIDNFSAAQARSTKDVECNVEICFWPENSQQEIRANSKALAVIQRTMPLEWLAHSPTVYADTGYYQGSQSEKHQVFGQLGEPLAFQGAEDPDKVFHRFVVILLQRAGLNGGAAAIKGPEVWRDWAESQTRNATPQELAGFVSE